MSAYTDFVEQVTIEPIVLFEIDIGEAQDFWIAYEAGIWMFKITNVTEGVSYDFQNGAFCYGSFENAGGPEDLGTNEVIKIVNSFEAAGEQYTSVSSLATLRSTNKSFYYDAATTIIYVHFDAFDPPDVFTNKKIGVTTGFSTRAIYLDDNYYEERLKSAPRISFSKDPLFWGILRFSENTIDLLNGDGYFDDFVQLDIYGQPARVKFGSPDLDYADFRTLFTGYVEKFSVDAERFSVSVADDRKKLSRKLPVNYWDDTTYSDIKPSNVGKPIPLAWGDIRNAPVVCTNEDEAGTPASYSFKICDTTNHAIDAITTVYVNGVEVTPDSTTLATATFVLLTADYDPGDKVTVDFTGYEDGGGDPIENALDVIVDILDDYAGVTYSADTFDTTEWAAAQALVYDVGLFVSKQKSIVNLIEDICTSVAGSFLVQNDGKYTFKITDDDAAAVMTILQDEQFGDPSVDFKTDEFLTSAIIEYNEDQEEDEYEQYPDTSRESDVFDRYQRYRERSFDTVLVTSAAAALLASGILDVSEEIPILFKIVTTMKATTLEISDNIVMQIDRVTREWFGNQKCELVGIDYDLNAMRVELTGRRIEAA